MDNVIKFPIERTDAMKERRIQSMDDLPDVTLEGQEWIKKMIEQGESEE